MAFKEGNKFWKLRSKHGRDKIFQTPEIMLEACYEYFEYQSTQVWNKIDYKGKDVEKVEIPISSPFSLKGLCIFLGVNSDYFSQFESNCSSDFSRVITHIKDVIYKQKYEGATVGVYNANIIARDLGLMEQKAIDVTTKGEKIQSEPDISKLSEDDQINFLELRKKAAQGE